MLKKVAILLGLLVTVVGLSVSQASAMQTFGSGKDKLFCIVGTFIMPSDTTITEWKVYAKSNADFTTSNLKALKRCMLQLFKIKNSYVEVPTGYPITGPYQVRFLVVLCSSGGGAYVFDKMIQKPQSFTYQFKRNSDYVSSSNPLFHENCVK